MDKKLLVEWKENQAGEREREKSRYKGEKYVLRGRKWSIVSNNVKKLSHMEIEMAIGFGWTTCNR